MNWSEMNLNEVDTDKIANGGGERTELPGGDYKFRLAGSKPSPYQSGTTDIDLVVAEGQYKGKVITVHSSRSQANERCASSTRFDQFGN